MLKTSVSAHDVPSIFTQIPNAKVRITGLRALKQYLKEHVRHFQGMSTIAFKTSGEHVYVWCHGPNGDQRFFYGFVEDVAHNVQRGLLA